MTGFKGTFSVNFELPDYIGLGKSVSWGLPGVLTTDCHTVRQTLLSPLKGWGNAAEGHSIAIYFEMQQEGLRRAIW
jgi:hypothetical protein